MGNLQQFPTAIPLQEIFCARFVGNNLPVSDAALGEVVYYSYTILIEPSVR